MLIGKSESLLQSTDIVVFRLHSSRSIAQLSGTSLGLSISQSIFQNLSVPRVAEILGPGYSLEQVTRIVTRIDEALIASLPADLYRQAQGIVIDAITNGLVLAIDLR